MGEVTQPKQDGVWLMGGVWAGLGTSKKWVELRDTGDGVCVSIDQSSATLTVAAARNLARQLYRSARRHELRTETK